MRELFGIAACLVFTTNSIKLNGKCEGDPSAPDFIVEIPHPDENSANVIYLRAGNCDETTVRSKNFVEIRKIF